MVKRAEMRENVEMNESYGWNGEPHEPTFVNFEYEPQVNEDELLDLDQVANKKRSHMTDPGMPLGGPMPPAAPILVTPPGGGPPPPGGGPPPPRARTQRPPDSRRHLPVVYEHAQ